MKYMLHWEPLFLVLLISFSFQRGLCNPLIAPATWQLVNSSDVGSFLFGVHMGHKRGSWDLVHYAAIMFVPIGD